MSHFDNISKATFSVVEQIMGDVAIWSPSALTSLSEKVLFSDPEKLIQLGDTDKLDYYESGIVFEYYIDQFIGLKALTDSGDWQTVTINGINYTVREVRTKVDGRTLIAYCNKNE